MHSPMQATLVMGNALFFAHDLVRKPVPTFRGHALRGELAAELILYVDADDVVKGFFSRGEAEFRRAVGGEVARPAIDDADDRLIGYALDAGDDVLAGDAPERSDLLADGGGQT